MTRHDAAQDAELDPAIRTGGAWLAVAATLLIVALTMHPPPPAEDAAFMELIADEGATWIAVHWLAAIALSLFVVAGLIVLSGRSALTARPLTLSAWAIFAVGAFWTVRTAVAEATAVSHVAASGDLAGFEAWNGYAGGNAMGFAVFGLAVAAIAADQASRATTTMPRWASGLAVALGVLSFSGWVLGSILGVGLGGPVWLVSSLLMNAWLVWFGVLLVRAPVAAVSGRAVHA